MALHTPRRFPHIAKRANKDALTPTRSKLRRFLKAPEDDYFTTLEVCINQRFPCVKAEITTYRLSQTKFASMSGGLEKSEGVQRLVTTLRWHMFDG